MILWFLNTIIPVKLVKTQSGMEESVLAILT